MECNHPRKKQFQQIMNMGTAARINWFRYINLLKKKPFDYFSATLLIQFGADVNQEKDYLEQVQIEKPDYAKNVSDPRSDGYHSGLKTFKCKATPFQLAMKMGNIPAMLFLQANGCDTSRWMMRGGEKVEIEESKDESVCEAMKGKWTPSLHKFYPKALKVILKTLLLCFQRMSVNYLITKDVIYRIFGYLSQYPIHYDILIQHREELIDKTKPTYDYDD